MLWRRALVVATAARAFTTVPVAVEQRSRRHTNVARSNFVDDLTAVATDFLSKLAPAPAPYNASNVAPGHVHRCAVKAKNLSRAPGWTTNKPSVPGMGLGLDGCAGDFNNYRSAALQNTRDRGVSIITTDVYKALTGEGWPVQHGDLGENLFVAMPYATFAVGRRFLIGMTALVEITEAIVPCARRRPAATTNFESFRPGNHRRAS